MLFVDKIEILSETISLINQLYLNYNQIYFSGHPKIYKMNKTSCTYALNEDILFTIPKYLDLLNQYKLDEINTSQWELQIWDIQDEEQNKKLHSAHEKQRDNILKEGGQ